MLNPNKSHAEADSLFENSLASLGNKKQHNQ
jgi:hypothetical protein